MDPSNQVVSTDLALDSVTGNLHIQKTIHLSKSYEKNQQQERELKESEVFMV